MNQSYREREPLYIITLRLKNAEQLFQLWAKENNRFDLKIENNRLSLYHADALNHFMVTWKKHWDKVVIWDTWNKRHL